MSHRDVLTILGCADLPTLIDPVFLHEFGLNNPEQYGIVAADVPDSIRRLRAAGASEFLYANMKPPDWRENGAANPGVEVEMALGYSNHQQIELLGPSKNTHLYSEHIPADGRPTLHHACVFQKGLPSIEQRLNQAGYPTVVSGNVGVPGLYTTRFRYFDTRDRLGMYLEVTEYLLFSLHTPPGEGLIRWVARRQGRFAD